jgi:hypothetical protein
MATRSACRLPLQQITEQENEVEMSQETRTRIRNVERSKEKGVKDAALQELMGARASNGGELDTEIKQL